MPTDKTCVKCLRPEPLAKFGKLRNGYRLNICTTCRGRRERAFLKLRVIEAFGGKCNCCGEGHPAFLGLDHINGRTAEQKNGQRYRTGTWKKTAQIWRQALREGCPKSEYQLLCMNCNFAKGLFGVCPHQSGVTVEQAMKKLREDAKGFGHEHRDYSGSSVAWFKPGHEGFRVTP